MKKLNPLQKAAIIIAVIILSITCTVAVYKNVVELSLLIFILIGFCLGMLSFLIVGNIAGDGGVFGFNIRSVSGGFAVFILVMLAYFLFYKDVFQIMKKDKEVLNIEDPSDTSIWVKPNGIFKWYNAPYAYAAESHLKTKYEWLKKPDFKLELLLFDSTDPSVHKEYCKPRFDGMVSFIRGIDSLNKVQSADIILKNKVSIKYFLTASVPTISFFTTRKADNERPYSIIYLIDKTDNLRVTECLTSESVKINHTLTNNFESYWRGNCVTINIDDVLNKNISADSLMNKLKHATSI